MFMLARLKMYAAFLGAAMLAIITVYYRGRSDAKQQLEYDVKDDRLEKLLAANKVKQDVQSLDDDELAVRARQWMRDDD